MDITKIVIDAIASTSAVEEICKKTGLKKTQVKSILKIAIPALMAAMAKNAASKEGAESLEKATKEHKSDKTVEEQIKNADLEDGAKIIKHILGGDVAKLTSSVAKQSDSSSEDVAKVLSTFAPVMLGQMSDKPVTESVGKIDAKDVMGALSAVDLSDGLDAKDVFGVLGHLMKK